MPKLPKKIQKAVEAADENVGGGFEPLEPGKYIATLKSVEARTSKNDNPMWAIEFEDIQDLEGDTKPGRQFYNLMLPTDMPADYSPKNSKKSPEDAWESYQEMVHGRLKQFFSAFGYEIDSDTDEMIGDRCVITLSVETINQGAKAGELTNRVTKMESLDSVEFAEGGGSDDDDDF